MAKEKTVFFCSECGYESSKWLGQCPACKNWDTFVEAPAAPKATARGLSSAKSGVRNAAVSSLQDISRDEEDRIHTGIEELDRVLGGGIVPGSLLLVGGDPGIGKSTLMLMMCRKLSLAGHRLLYVSGEESLRQIRMRADRLGEFGKDLLLLAETNLEVISDAVTREKPEIVVIDSIQTMYREEMDSAPGSVTQVRECAGFFLRLAKSTGVTVFLIGHVTKEGAVAGPRVLEHMVDTVLYFEGEDQAAYRILRSVKNRFGSTNEIGVFEMHQNGLVEIENPSEYMLSGRPKGEAGSVVACTMEGTRPILVEVQALVCQTTFAIPRRTAAGMDFNRVNLLLAVLEKRLKLPLRSYDAYANVAGGMRVKEPALDLALVLSLLSSYTNLPVPEKTLVFGEVGLTGEVRAVSLANQRVAEARKLGFTSCILPAANLTQLRKAGMSTEGLLGCKHVRELLVFLQNASRENKEEETDSSTINAE